MKKLIRREREDRMSAKHLAALREKERRRDEQPAIKRLKMTETGIQSVIESESEDY